MVHMSNDGDITNSVEHALLAKTEPIADVGLSLDTASGLLLSLYASQIDVTTAVDVKGDRRFDGLTGNARRIEPS